MKRIIMILIMLMVASSCFAFDPWTTQDTVLQSAFTALTCIDLWQTYTFLYIDKDGAETNPFMGEHPSKQRFFIIGGGGIVLHSAISYIIPKPYRAIWQFIFIADEIYFIHHNYQFGVRLKF
jgi:hypothetical protein